MGALPSALRNQLAKVCVAAREAAETGARSALQSLAVHHHEPHGSMTPEQRDLRNRLRAHGRQLGDTRDPKRGTQTIDRLVHECAYQHWHRMLFARFLAENHLLIEPTSGAAITMEECQDLARESGQDPWALASRFAQRMLPQIFRTDDPVLEVALPPETRQTLERLLADLPAAAFTADDSLGWTYQLWQSAEKDRVNASGEKITAATLPAVTQLFTEPYMVQFLLHNTLGAWWAGKKLTSRDREGAESEQDLRKKVALPGVTWDYLRFVRGEDGQKGPWRPAAGTFDGWPKAAKDIKVLDPCCGSGHFLVAALHHLVPIRMAEEGLSAAAAVDAVLRDNLHGLEIDERCCQIAAFNLALAAWKISGWKSLPPLHIACSGIGPQCSEEEWVKVAEKSGVPMPAVGREAIRNGLLNLHRLFSQAPTLGSLINPAELPADLIAADYETIQPYLAAILKAEQADDETRERAIAAAGMVKAADLLAAEYTLVITNVPYLGRGKQDSVLKKHLETHFPAAKADLATAFVQRCLEFCQSGNGIVPPASEKAAGSRFHHGSVALVTPQNWLFLTSYRKFRERLLKERTWNLVARLGEHAFESNAAAGAFAAMMILSGGKAATDNIMAGIDVSAPRGQRPIFAAEKAALLRGESGSGFQPLESRDLRQAAAAPRDDEPDNPPGPGAPPNGSITLVPQAEQLKNPDARISLVAAGASARLEVLARSFQGIATGDFSRFGRCFWEIAPVSGGWELEQSTVEVTQGFGGKEHILLWEGGRGDLSRSDQARVQGLDALGRAGITVSQMSSLPVTRFDGTLFDNNSSALCPRDAAHLPAIWCFCSSPEFAVAVRRIDQKLNVTNATLVKVPFDLAHWQRVAAEKYPEGLPEPQSNDPTQWLFHGHPAGMVAAGLASASPLGIADPVGADRHPSLICRTPNPAAVLQVAVARLLGYRWPAELDGSMRLDAASRAWVSRCAELHRFADEDGIVCISPVRGEESAAERLRHLLAAAFGDAWSAECERRLIAATGSKETDLDGWLRNDFFEQHCKLFHDRPFIWHIWDGRPDGFHALVNYHKLCGSTSRDREGADSRGPLADARGSSSAGRRLLESLTYAYLGDWIERQKAEQREGQEGADARLAAAQDLQEQLRKILEGEPPYDIFVRWKPLREQPIGWEPDINDGVRLNIRPFMRATLRTGGKKGAGILRAKPNINWKKDRGKEPQSLRPKADFPWFWSCDPEKHAEHRLDFMGGATFDGNRWNDLHYSNEVKRAARVCRPPEGAGRR